VSEIGEETTSLQKTSEGPFKRAFSIDLWLIYSFFLRKKKYI